MNTASSAMYALLVDLIAPPRCSGCERHGELLCDRCRTQIISAAPLIRMRPPVLALGDYAGLLRNVVLALKFRGQMSVGVSLGEMLGWKLTWAADIIVPVPLHSKRLRRRGYNQACAIAIGLAGARGLPISHALSRMRDTDPQSSLALGARLINVRCAFMPGPAAGDVVGKRVLLVDDVVTTGATAAACSSMLLRAGAREVRVAALAVKL